MCPESTSMYPGGFLSVSNPPVHGYERVRVERAKLLLVIQERRGVSRRILGLLLTMQHGPGFHRFDLRLVVVEILRMRHELSQVEADHTRELAAECKDRGGGAGIGYRPYVERE